MIHHLTGNFFSKNPTQVIIEAGGVGYVVKISLQTWPFIEKREQGMLFIHHHFSGDGIQSLFGFSSMEERMYFIHLLSVNGVGPNTAQLILSYMKTDEIHTAILHGNDLAFKKVKGVGEKTAKRIILDLKDKIQKLSGVNLEAGLKVASSPMDEAMDALLALGFNRLAIQKCIQQLQKDLTHESGVELWIKGALRLLTT